MDVPMLDHLFFSTPSSVAFGMVEVQTRFLTGYVIPLLSAPDG
jgi:hypothetical protein